MIRLLALVALGVFVYTRFDTLWTGVRSVTHPVTAWNKMMGRDETGNGSAAKAGHLAWSPDSGRVSLECARGLSSSCCDDLNRADGGLCGAAASLLEKARWKGALTAGANDRPLHLEARAVVGDLGEWGYELAGLSGRDGAGAFAFRRAAGSNSWCDSRRGCLKSSVARAPLLDGHPLVTAAGGSGDPVRAGTTFVRWASLSPRVRAVMAGRIASIAAVRSADSGAVEVTVYHGEELYVTYGPLRAVPGVKAGALVKAGSYLGDARAQSEAGYVLTVGLRRGGQPVDAAAFWGLPAFGDEPSGPALSATGAEVLGDLARSPTGAVP